MNKLFCTPILIASLLAALAGCPAAAQTEPPQDDQAGSRDEMIKRTVDELFETSEAISESPGGDEAVVFDGPGDEPRWLQGLTVTKSQNPMLTRECREQAMRTSLSDLREQHGYESDSAAMHDAVQHMFEHRDFIRDNEVSHVEYLRSIAKCEKYCAPLIASMMQCHKLSVARHPHGVVMFDLGESTLKSQYRDGVIQEIADKYQQGEGTNILLIGRASRIGDLRYNRRLSAQRALAVRDALIETGVPMDAIRPLWFGWEPPQLDAATAEEYGIASMFQQMGRQQLNQSVVMVIFE